MWRTEKVRQSKTMVTLVDEDDEDEEDEEDEEVDVVNDDDDKQTSGKRMCRTIVTLALDERVICCLSSA